MDLTQKERVLGPHIATDVNIAGANLSKPTPRPLRQIGVAHQNYVGSRHVRQLEHVKGKPISPLAVVLHRRQPLVKRPPEATVARNKRYRLETLSGKKPVRLSDRLDIQPGISLWIVVMAGAEARQVGARGAPRRYLIPRDSRCVEDDTEAPRELHRLFDCETVIKPQVRETQISQFFNARATQLLARIRTDVRDQAYTGIAKATQEPPRVPRVIHSALLGNMQRRERMRCPGFLRSLDDALVLFRTASKIQRDARLHGPLHPSPRTQRGGPSPKTRTAHIERPQTENAY